MERLAVIWRAGGDEGAEGVLFAIDGCSILEVLPPLPVRPLPGTAGWIRGLTSHRGASIPVVDTCLLLGLERGPDLMVNRVIVVPLPAPHGSRSLGLWVGAVLDVRRVDFAAREAHPGVDPAGAVDVSGRSGPHDGRLRPRLLGPLGPTPWGLAQLLEPRELFDQQGWSELVGRLAEVDA